MLKGKIVNADYDGTRRKGRGRKLNVKDVDWISSQFRTESQGDAN